MRIAYHVLSAPAPLGLLFAAKTDRGLRYLEYMDRRSLKRTIAAHAAENPDAVWEPSVRELRPLADQLERYFCGTLRTFDVALDPVGGEQPLRIWRALLAIPFGETRSYGDIAKAIGEPHAARVVGQVAHQNPIAIVVPCHRVIGADGKLVGYAGGLPRKKALLALEARFRSLPDHEESRVIETLVVKVPASPPAPARARKPVKPPAKPASKRRATVAAASAPRPAARRAAGAASAARRPGTARGGRVR